MFKNNRKNQSAVHKTLLENLHVRLVEIKQLAESRNLLSKQIVTFIKNELIRCRSDVNAVKHANKEVPLFNLQNEIESIINDIEYGIDEQALSHGATMLSSFYPELQRYIKESTKIEIFAGFEKMEPGDEAEIPGVSYGVKLLLETGEERIHILKSSGDGCLMSDMSNERRKRTLNVAIAVVSDILHAIDPHGKSFSSLDISIRTDIEIFGFTVPSGWKVQQPPASVPEVHHGDFKIIPPSYFEYIVDKKLRYNIFNDQVIVIFSIEKNLPYQYREFGVKFIQGEEIKTKIVLFETVANDVSFIVSRMNYTILFVEQFIFKHIIQKDFRDFSDLKVMIETDFDTEDLYNPHQFEIIKQ
ncbi:hypothetical protein OM416_19755 [Paenibacillus sp. LS1]|uniref:hypothetical protein n=1 Tax=Paenibacillus sp. LS1 TaxID=2992120 RepID=UPI00222E3524|nr:hypothetical protein [Paenibacillus sp. LS1]MCW3793831.1 hypothetical protein [Paenibacillus sp. LS1]